MIVAIEGIDASGKQTQVKRLVEESSYEVWPYSKPTPCETHDFPHYASETGQLLKRLLKGETVVAPFVEIEQMVDRHFVDSNGVVTSVLQTSWSLDKARIIQGMMIVDRLEWQHLLRPFKGVCSNLLLLDRYTMSGLAYGVADGLSKTWLEQVQAPLIQADLHIVLDIPVTESIRRRPDRRDYYERNSEKLEKVRTVYTSEALAYRGVHVINGMRSVEDVSSSIVDIIRHFQSRLRNG